MSRLCANSGPRSWASRAGFTILEVMVALGILALALVVLIDSQATAVMMTVESERMIVSRMLAEEKLAEVLLLVETGGFKSQDIEEEGDFSRGLFGEFMPGGLDGHFDEINTEAYEEYQWAFVVREIDLSAAGDLMGGAQEVMDAGREDNAPQAEDQSPDLGDVGFTGDMLTDMLSPYIREVRVMVWWGDVDPEDSEEDVVELVVHVINPTGLVTDDGVDPNDPADAGGPDPSGGGK